MWQEEKKHYVRLSLVPLSQPLVQSVASELESTLKTTFALDLHDGTRVLHHLDESHTVPNG